MAPATLDRQGTVGVLTMSHERENRFHPDLMAGIMGILDEVEKDDTVRALVVTGSDPKFFCNGLDLGWLMEHMGDMGEILGYLQKVNALYRRFCLYPKPVVAALNGHTFAGGAFMAAHMDFRFMRADRGWVCLPEVEINIPLLPGMVAIMQAVTNPSAFKEMYYTGKRYTGPEALATGYVDKLFPADELLPQSVAFAAMLGSRKTRTYAEMKRRLRADVVRVMDEQDPALFMTTLALAVPE